LNALEEKISNYRSLEKLIGELNSSLSLDKTINTPIDWVFMLVAQKQGTAILYLMDNRKQKLEIFTTRKEDSRVVIKTKEGDIFDQWVLRHNTDLLVEDTKKDFRFDLEKIAQDEFRSLGSIISAPLIRGSNFLGILRLENFSAGKFNLDDLRLLRNIADLGAVAVENASLYQHTEELAIKDGLTGLYLRNYLSERMEEELKRAQKTNQPISFLMIDIDHFKIYNDKFGHIAGDIVLKNIAKTLKESFEPKDNIASRVGGEEFGLLLIGKDKKEAKKIAEELRKKIHSEKLILRRKETSITVSIGVASFPIDASSKEDLINQADTALYKAKKSGRNCVCSI
jgi:diguanylate cyclase (GGDEF)-like protein